MASTIRGRIDKGIFNFDRRVSSCRGDTNSSNASFRASTKHLLRTEQEESTICSLIFRKTRIAKYADARKLQARHAQEIPTIGRTEIELPRFWR